MRFLPRHSPSGLLSAAVVILAIGVGLFLIAAGIASFEVGSTRRAWAETLGSKQQLFDRFPLREPSASALRLEALTPALGIVTTPRDRVDAKLLLRPSATPFSKIKKEMMSYASSQFGKTQRAIDPAPEAVLAFLEGEADKLAAVRELLTESEELHWEQELPKLFAAPIPNLLGHLDLVKLLLVDALVALEQGERARALADLEAVWKLSQALQRDPMMITQLVAAGDMRMLTGVLRQVPDAPPIWRERLAAQDVRAAFLEAMEIEAWMWAHAPVGGGIVGEFDSEASAFITNLPVILGKPYIQLCLAQASDANREQIERFKRLPAICDYDLASLGADPAIALPRWNVLGKLMTPHLETSLARVAQLELDLELTRAVLDLDAGRTASNNAGSSVRSDACPQDAWLLDWSLPEQVVLSLSREVRWEGLQGHRSPQRFALGRAPLAAQASN